MKCPYCNEADSKVIDSRPAYDSARIRRRRECLACGKRFTTYEIVETVALMVIKKDKSREAFDREKLLQGLMRASYKRPVSYQTLEGIVDAIEQILLSGYEREVSSIRVGELAMQELKKVDEVAYVRFASVYRQFSDINTFMDELKELLSKQADELKKK
ncbi:MAG: transcriptional regulator NrdR [Oscillospiraceae bacterium]